MTAKCQCFSMFVSNLKMVRVRKPNRNCEDEVRKKCLKQEYSSVFFFGPFMTNVSIFESNFLEKITWLQEVVLKLSRKELITRGHRLSKKKRHLPCYEKRQGFYLLFLGRKHANHLSKSRVVLPGKQDMVVQATVGLQSISPAF